MGQVIPFAFEDHLVRVVPRNDEPWFVGRDVCHVLEIRNETQALARLDPDEREDGVSITDPIGRKQEVIVISEPGVYRLVFTSRKPEAERFKRWLAHEVLPQLRRTGAFALDKPAEPPKLDEEPLAIVNAKLGMIREARLIFGAAAARLLWAQLGMPALPIEGPVASYGMVPEDGEADEDALACLRHLLSYAIIDEPFTRGENVGARSQTLAQLIDRAFNGDEDSRFNLLTYGIRIEDAGEENRFWVASYGKMLERIYAGSKWAGTWRFAIRRLPGAHHSKNYKVEGETSRGYSLAERYLEPLLRG